MELKEFKIKSRRIFGFLLDLVLPRQCLSCGKIGRWICEACSDKLTINLTEMAISDCQDVDRWFYVADFNDRLIGSMVRALKYKGTKELGNIIGLMMKTELETDTEFLIADPIYVPIPLHGLRERERGFNQSMVIARAIAPDRVISALKRKINTKPQAMLDREARLANLNGCFEVCGEAKNLEDKTVLLIDDVITTGTTMNEAAKALKAAGAEQVWGLAFAHGV